MPERQTSSDTQGSDAEEPGHRGVGREAIATLSGPAR